MKHISVFKRALCATLVVLMLTMTALPAMAAGKKPSGAYVVTTAQKKGRLYVRSSPWGAVKAKLKKGTVVVYNSSKSGWWKVSYRNGSGYVDGRYLTSVASLGSTKYVSVDNLRVRSKPKANAVVLGKLKPKMKVTIVGQKGSWVCVNYKGYTGWVSAKYLRRA